MQEGSKVIIKDLSGNQKLDEFVPSVDIIIEPNSIILVDGRLYAIETLHHIGYKKHQIDVYWQDAVLAKDGMIIESAMND